MKKLKTILIKKGHNSKINHKNNTGNFYCIKFNIIYSIKYVNNINNILTHIIILNMHKYIIRR